MRTFFTHFWSKLRTSFWFVPGGLVALSVAVAYATLAADREWKPWLLSTFEGLDKVSAEGIRSLLSTAATAVLTLAGVTFSATLVALTLASSQFGSRLLRNFIRSTPNQIALGVLLGNFVLCLIVLRSVRGAEGGEFIPHIAAFAAFVATLTSLATFIYFIHHIAISLQADRIVADVHRELDASLERYFPDERPKNEEEQKVDEEKENWDEIVDEKPVRTRKEGYIQAIDIAGLVESAARLDIRCRLLLRPGQFVHAGAPLIAVSHPSDTGDDPSGAAEDLLEHILIGRIRTAEQDFEYCLRLLVEVATRALSPGINDPFTAMNCVDYLGAALAKVATRKLPHRVFDDREGEPRVRSRPTNFADLLDAAFHQIRQAADGRVDVTIRLLDALRRVVSNAMVESHRKSVFLHAEALRSIALNKEIPECDREAIVEAYDRVMETESEQIP